MKKEYNFTLSELTEMYQNASRQISIYRDTSVKQFLFKPGPGSWSAHDVCRHLIVFGNNYLKQMDKAITKTKPLPQSKGPFRPRWHFRYMANFFEPPARMKVKTLPLFQPGNFEEVSRTLDELSAIQANVLNMLDEAKPEQWDLHKIKGKNPAFRFLSMSLIEFLVIMEVHQRRHFWQIEENFKVHDEM